MDRTREILDYVTQHFRQASTGRLAVRLGLSYREVRHLLRANGLARQDEDRRWIEAHPDHPLPKPNLREIRPLERRDWLCGLAVFLGTLAVYLKTMAPTVTGEDGGELVTAAYELGIAHPPGYPIWCLVGKLFTLLVPFGDIAFRVNCVSGVFGALSAAGVTLVVCVLAECRLAAVVAGLLFGVSLGHWSQCVIPEVYTLNAFFTVLMVLLVFHWQRTRDFWLLCGIAYLYGLSLTNHSTMGPLIVVFAPYILWHWPAAFRTPRILLLGAFFLLGFAIYLYLPIRSVANPFMDWGDPETPYTMFRHMMRKVYTEGAPVRVHTIPRYLAQVWEVFVLYGKQFTWALAPVPLVGAVLAVRRSRKDALLLLGLFLLIVLGITYYTNFNVTREDIWVQRVFFIPAWLVAAIWAGYALAIAVKRLKPLRRVPIRRLATAALVLLPVLPLATYWRENDFSRYYYAADYARNILETVRPNAILLPSADHVCFPLIYLHAVCRMRPDIVLGDKYGYLEKRFLQKLARDSDDLATAEKLPKEQLYSWIVERTNQYVYFTNHPNIPRFPTHELRSLGLTYEAAPRWSPYDAEYEDAAWEKYTWRNHGFILPLDFCNPFRPRDLWNAFCLANFRSIDRRPLRVPS